MPTFKHTSDPIKVNGTTQKLKVRHMFKYSDESNHLSHDSIVPFFSRFLHFFLYTFDPQFY